MLKQQHEFNRSNGCCGQCLGSVYYTLYFLLFWILIAEEQHLTNTAVDYSSKLSPLDQRLVKQFDSGDTEFSLNVSTSHQRQFDIYAQVTFKKRYLAAQANVSWV